MLRITIPEVEFYNEQTGEFEYAKGQTLQLEHSLVSISKWESKWCKPFMSTDNKTEEETQDYVRCMTLTQNVDPDVYKNLTSENLREIEEYIAAPMTATWFSEDKQKGKGGMNKRIITNELIYYWMIAHNIPHDYQKWHLNRLLTLIRVCNAESEQHQQRSQKEIASSHKALNEARRRQARAKRH